MLSLIFLVLGVIIIVLGSVAYGTKNADLMSKVMKRKPDEDDQVYLKRGFTMALILGAAIVVISLLMW